MQTQIHIEIQKKQKMRKYKKGFFVIANSHEIFRDREFSSIVV